MIEYFVPNCSTPEFLHWSERYKSMEKAGDVLKSDAAETNIKIFPLLTEGSCLLGPSISNNSFMCSVVKLLAEK